MPLTDKQRRKVYTLLDAGHANIDIARMLSVEPAKVHYLSLRWLKDRERQQRLKCRLAGKDDEPTIEEHEHAVACSDASCGTWSTIIDERTGLCWGCAIRRWKWRNENEERRN